MRTTQSDKSDAIEKILAARKAFLEFVSGRVEDREVAEDILHSCYVKAIEHAEELRNGESSVAWFYRILRNATIDHYRRRDSRAKADEALMLETPVSYEEEWAATVCACIGGAIGGLKPEYGDAVQQVDLGEVPLEHFAKQRNLTVNNAAVRLHRARKALAKRLTTICGACAIHHCLDCTCKQPEV